jgi:hypothetical protein
MGVVPPQQKFGLDDETLGFCMQGYYGGRAEIRIRHTPVPVVYTDFTREYPNGQHIVEIVAHARCLPTQGSGYDS